MAKESKRCKEKKHICKNSNLSEVYRKIIEKLPSHMSEKMREKDSCTLGRLLSHVSRPCEDVAVSLQAMREAMDRQEGLMKGEITQDSVQTAEIEGNTDEIKMLNFDSDVSGTMLQLPVAFGDFALLAEKQKTLDFFL